MAGRVAKIKKSIATRRTSAKTRRRSLEKAVETFHFQLFVTGSTGKSALAISNAKRVFEEHLKGRYSLEIVDLYQQPHLAQGSEIVAVPTLIKRAPGTICQFIGDLSDTKNLIRSIYGSD